MPGKPLLAATGKPLIQHVVERARQVRDIAEVVVATDDDRIRAAVEAFGCRGVMTRADHPSGTDRVAEAVGGLDADVVVNLQGDEPLFDPAGVDLLVRLLADDPAADVSTLATPIRSVELYRDPNAVKVVRDDAGRALVFSRSPVPFVRDGEPDFLADPSPFLLHLGVYAYRRAALERFTRTPPHWLEKLEKLEQLRLLGTGGVIQVGVVAAGHRGVDTPADYAAFVAAVGSYGRPVGPTGGKPGVPGG